jgi:hypothetical protein
VKGRCLYGQSAAVKLNFRAAFGPEDAVAGQQIAIFRLDMQIDIKRIGASER